MLANQILQPLNRFRFRDIEFHRGLTNVKVHLARRATNISEIRIRHFARAIHNTTHDRNLHPFEMRRRRFDPRRRGLKIEQGSATRGTRDVIRLKNPRAGRLQNVVTQTQRLPRCFLPLNQNRVTNSVAQKRADIRSRNQQSLKKV